MGESDQHLAFVRHIAENKQQTDYAKGHQAVNEVRTWQPQGVGVGVAQQRIEADVQTCTRLKDTGRCYAGYWAGRQGCQAIEGSCQRRSCTLLTERMMISRQFAQGQVMLLEVIHCWQEEEGTSAGAGEHHLEWVAAMQMVTLVPQHRLQLAASTQRSQQTLADADPTAHKSITEGERLLPRYQQYPPCKTDSFSNLNHFNRERLIYTLELTCGCGGTPYYACQRPDSPPQQHQQADNQAVSQQAIR